MAKFLSEEWIKQYAEVWNNDEELVSGLKGFNATIKYFIDGSDQPPVYIKVEDGKVVEAGLAEEGKEYDFEMWASIDNWKKLATGELGPKKAMMFRKLKFKGDMATAMAKMGPFSRSLQDMSKVPTEW